MYVKNKPNRSRQEGQPHSDSSISTDWLELAFEKLKGGDILPSTRQKYHQIHKNFNRFVGELTRKPDNWEDKIHLYFTFLAETGKHENTLKTYLSAIKKVLTTEGETLENLDNVALASIIKSCKYNNNEVIHRLPINYHMLLSILDATDQVYNQQPYLAILYKAMFSAAYNGLLRVGEMTKSQHSILARDVLIAKNKRKIQFILRTSKTHGLGDPPQIIAYFCDCAETKMPEYCPYELMVDYNEAKGKFRDGKEQYFVYKGHIPVEGKKFRQVLKNMIKHANIDCEDYNVHSFRIGHANDMRRLGKDISYIKNKGRWRSSTVWKYLKYGCFER